MTYGEFQSGQMNRQALSDVGRLGLLMAGLGMGWRGLQGVGNVYRRNTRARPVSLTHTDYVDVPPREEKRAEERWLESGLKPFVRPFTEALKGNVQHYQNLPWYQPALAAAAIGGGYGGYHLTDKVLDQRRKTEIDSELEEARNAYLQALQGGSKLAAELDRLCDATGVEKQASGDAISPDTAGFGLGALATVLGLGSLGTGLWAYDAARKRQPSDVLEEAKNREARNRMNQRPSPIYARLAPTGSGMSLVSRAV